MTLVQDVNTDSTFVHNVTMILTLNILMVKNDDG